MCLLFIGILGRILVLSKRQNEGLGVLRIRLFLWAQKTMQWMTRDRVYTAAASFADGF